MNKNSNIIYLTKVNPDKLRKTEMNSCGKIVKLDI